MRTITELYKEQCRCSGVAKVRSPVEAVFLSKNKLFEQRGSFLNFLFIQKPRPCY